MRSARLAALLLAAACGTGTDGKPVTPPTTPEPAPAPEAPPEPPGQPTGIRVVDQGQDFIVWAWDPVDSATGYEAGVFPAFTPPGERGEPIITVEPTVRAEGLEPETEYEIYVRAVRETAGERAVGPWSATSPVVFTLEPPGEPRVCTDERELALAFHGGPLPVREWDGTPIRVDMIRNFPGLTETDVADLLEAVAHVARKIEGQLGYRILEMGELIPVPEGMQPGWNTDAPRHRRTCPLPRNPGQILGFCMDGTNDNASSGAGAQANSSCGDFCFLRPMLGDLQAGENLDRVTLHEIFHLLGFDHDPTLDPATVDRVGGVIMSYTLTRAIGPDASVVQWNDIDLLRCIFPEGG